MSELHDATSHRAGLPETPGVGLLEISTSMRITAANGRAGELLGHEPKALSQTHLSTLVAPEGVARLAEAFSVASDTTLRGTAQAVPFARPRQQRAYLDVEAVAIEADAGRRVLVSLWDVTGYALREKRSESLAANVPGVLFQLFVRADGRYGFYYVSARCFDLFGTAPTALMRDPSAMPLDPTEQQRFESSLRECFACRCNWSYEGRLRIGSLPARWWQAEGKLVSASSAEIVLDGLAYDVTERRQTQEELARAIEAREKFLSHMSHELRTPLNAIIGSAQSLKRSGGAELRQRPAIRSILESSDHLLSLVNDVIDLATIESGHLAIERRPFDVSQMVERVSSIASATADARRVQITTDGCRVAVSLIGDERRIAQILLNLLSNAVKFAADGTVEVSVTVERTSGGHELVATVSDDGPGIDAEEAARLFAPFSQGVQAVGRGGSGLGLAISRELAEAMGGTLSLGPTDGTGATFQLRLPIEIDTTSPTLEHPSGSKATQPARDKCRDRRAPAVSAAAIPKLLRDSLRAAAERGDMHTLQAVLPQLRELAAIHHDIEWLVAFIERFEIERVAEILQQQEEGGDDDG